MVNDYIDAFISASGVRPWVDFVEKMISEGHALAGSRIEDVGKRDQDRGCKERDQQNDRTRQSEPAWRQTGEEQDEEFVAGDGEPVDEDVQPVGGGGPFGKDEEAMKNDYGDRRTDEKEPQSRRYARPEDPQKKYRYRRHCEGSGCQGDVHAFCRLTAFNEERAGLPNASLTGLCWSGIKCALASGKKNAGASVDRSSCAKAGSSGGR